MAYSSSTDDIPKQQWGWHLSAAGVGKPFSTRAAVINFKTLKRAAQYVAKAVSKLDCHTIRMKSMPKSFETQFIFSMVTLSMFKMRL